MSMRHLGTVFAAALLIATAAAAGEIETYSAAEPLKGARESRVDLEIGLSRLVLKAGDEETLIRIDGRYFEEYDKPEFTVRRDEESAEISFSFGSREEKDEKLNWKNNKRQVFNFELNPIVETWLNMDFGLGKADLDLTRLKLHRFTLDAGLGDMSIAVDEANPVRAREVNISTGLGSFESDHLGNLQFDHLKLESGLGDMDVDLRGFTGEADVDIAIGLGSLRLILPEGLGVRIHYDKSFLADVTLTGLDKVHKGVYETDNWDTAQSKVVIDLSVGLGSVDVDWKR
ncbi:MAG TPA: hypothetical protein ENI92_03975 [Bacteroidetes bacterium]|nr:hypothetical protein [Bacteroidota bacterium]